MEKIYNVSDFAEKIGKSVKTLQRWDREGILKSYRSPTNRRYYTETQYLEFMGKTKTSDKVNVIYARVLRKKQHNALYEQSEFVRKICMSKGISISKIYTDYGSGLDYKRPSWNNLINDCVNGKISKIFISNKDRFVRFGYDWICGFLKYHYDVDIIDMGNIESSHNEEILSDMMEISNILSEELQGDLSCKFGVKKK